jgi:hypothetical protein
MEGKRLFEELAEDGENVRDRANGKVHELKSKAKDKIKKTIVKLREIVHLEKNDNTQDLSLQIEELSKAVKALSAAAISLLLHRQACIFCYAMVTRNMTGFRRIKANSSEVS